MMKTFEERKKEIRRRSEKRIVKRRQLINRLTGAALCLLCVATAAAIWPRAENDNTSANGAACEYAGNGIANEIGKPAGQENIPAGGMPETHHEEYTSLEPEEVGLEVTKIDTDADTLTVAMSNDSEQQITYGPGFDIEHETADGWVSCAETEMGWDAILYVLEPGDTVTEEYWTGSFDLSQPGAYRFVKYCNLYVEEDSPPCRVVAEFTVEETPQPPAR